MFQKRYGFTPAGEYNHYLDSKGERITLVNAAGDTIFTVKYNNKAPWPESADGDGYSIVAKNINGYGNPDSAGYWRASLNINGSPGRDDLSTGIEDGKNQQPDVFQLYQNFPNPFNPTTQLSYTISQSGFISLKVFNMLGQQVAILYEGVQLPGTYQVTFNAAHLASGVYFYRMQAGSFVETKKMLLIH
jgi:hypothetical protein